MAVEPLQDRGAGRGFLNPYLLGGVVEVAPFMGALLDLAFFFARVLCCFFDFALADFAVVL
jgi:hypothetical protein